MAYNQRAKQPLGPRFNRMIPRAKVLPMAFTFQQLVFQRLSIRVRMTHLMQYCRKHLREGMRVFKQDCVRIQPYRTFALAQSHNRTPSCAAICRPVSQPPHANVTSKPTAEEDGIEVAECFDDKIGTPETVMSCGYCTGYSLNGTHFQFPWSSAQVVVLENFQACLPRGDKWTLILLREPSLSGWFAISTLVFWVLSSS